MSDDNSQAITVLGPGSWGSALALVLAKNGNAVRLWGNDPQQMQTIATTGFNKPFVDVKFPANIEIFTDFNAAVADVQDILIVVPTVAVPEILSQLGSSSAQNYRIAWATKGILNIDDQIKLMPDYVQQQFPNVPMAVLSGPSFAAEVANGMHTCVNIAGNNTEFTASLATRFRNPSFAINELTDMVAVSLGGVIKNVFAIIAGMSDGLNWGANARCALISWGYKEMAAIIEALGGKIASITEVACIGDLILTCTDNQSRNRRFGLAVGAGKTRQQALDEIGSAVEGVANVQPIRKLAQSLQLQTPLLDAAYSILFADQSCQTTLEALFTRDNAS